LHWFASYLSNRSQSVEINGNFSQFKQITCGVPQGSIIGPFLFILYINDIISSSSVMKFILFADDTNLFFSHRSLDRLISTVNQELINIANWLNINKLSLNVNKTHFILLHFEQMQISNTITVKIGSDDIARVSHTKFLGVILNENLTWSHHIATLSNKVIKNIGILRCKLRYKLPCNILLTLYRGA